MPRRLIVLGALGALALAIAARLLGKRPPESAPGPAPAPAKADPAPKPAAKPKPPPKPKPAPEAKGGGVTGYCVRDKKKVEIQEPKAVETKNGRPAIRGTCPDCGGSIFRLGKMP